MKSKKALLYGVGSYKNRGVEALVASTIQLVDAEYDEIKIASYDLPYNEKYYNAPNHHYINHYRFYEELDGDEQKQFDYYKTIPFDYHNFEKIHEKQVIDAMDDVDICISIGGDNYCYGANNWLYTLTREAKAKNKLSVLWGASLFEEIDDLELVHNLKQFDLLLIRETISYDALKKFIDEDKLLLAADPAFGLTPKKIKIPSWYQNRDVIGINLSPLTIKDEAQYEAFQQFMDYILQNTHYSISLIPHVLVEHNDDRDILVKLYEKYQENNRVRLEEVEKFQYQEIKYLISSFRFMIVARTHLSISAYSQCIPTLVIGYSVKSKGIAKDLFGSYQDYVLSKDCINYENLVKGFSFLEENQEQIVSTLKNKMKDYVPQAKKLLSLVLDKVEQNEKKEICGKENCVGCGVCYQVCPHHAIEMIKNEEGFLVPKINLEKCTSCNLCRKSCPVLKNVKCSDYQVKCYAMKNKKKELLNQSSSGAVFPVLAQSILNEHGVVYGATFTDGQTYHIRIDHEKDLLKIQGSKYTQSNIHSVLPKIKEDLDKNKKVLFSGTSCQVGAVKSFLKKDYANLYCVSVICHGVINDDLWKRYATEIGIKEQDYNSFKFKDKENGWNASSVSYLKAGKKNIVEFLNDSLMYLYLRNYILRDSCYHCKFKGLSSIEADLILGDYWGIHLYHPEFFDKSGVSCVITNSSKGHELLDKSGVFSSCDWILSDIENIYESNPMILKSVDIPFERYQIFSDFMKNEISMVSKSLKFEEERNQLARESEQAQSELNAKASELSLLAEQAQYLQAELDKIYYSRRWTIPTKIINIIKRKK